MEHPDILPPYTLVPFSRGPGTSESFEVCLEPDGQVVGRLHSYVLRQRNADGSFSPIGPVRWTAILRCQAGKWRSLFGNMTDKDEFAKILVRRFLRRKPVVH